MSATRTLRTGAQALAALDDLPGGSQLARLAADGRDIELVGGAVRDLLLGETPRELDVVVADDAAGFAQELAQRLDAQSGEVERFRSNDHERFRTALVWWPEGRIDVATRRSEHYPEPGSLPEVGEGTPDEDLLRRDFTVNAIALPLGGPSRGEPRTVPGALEDLATGRLRVLHDASFLDDPTRLFRLARYRARLGFTIEEHTAALAAAALDANALRTVSKARLGAELRLALSEADIVAAIASIDSLGLLRRLDSGLSFDEELAREALAFLREASASTRPDLLLLTSLLVSPLYPEYQMLDERARDQTARLLDDLQFSAADRDLVLRSLIEGPSTFGWLAHAETPSKIYEAASRAPLEAVALVAARAFQYAGGNGHPATRAARRWLTELHRVRLNITGDDLLAAGMSQGPEIGRRLEAVLRMRLDGELPDDPAAQVRAALEHGP